MQRSGLGADPGAERLMNTLHILYNYGLCTTYYFCGLHLSNELNRSFQVLRVIFFVLGSALKCHICNSGDNYEGDECADPIDDDSHLYDCDEYGRENNWPQYINATLCRKMVQKGTFEST